MIMAEERNQFLYLLNYYKTRAPRAPLGVSTDEQKELIVGIGIGTFVRPHFVTLTQENQLIPASTQLRPAPTFRTKRQLSSGGQFFNRGHEKRRSKKSKGSRGGGSFVRREEEYMGGGGGGGDGDHVRAGKDRSDLPSL